MGFTFDIANDGIEAVKKIRKYEKEHNLKPILISAFTANVLPGEQEKFIMAGMDYYLAKPLDVNKLKEILSKVKK